MNQRPFVVATISFIVATLVTVSFLAPAQALDAPPNDNFVNRQTLTGLTGSVVGNTTGATREPGERRDNVWYQWTAPRSGTEVFVNPIGATVALFSASRRPNSVSDLTELGFSFGLPQQISVHAGTTYYIGVNSSSLDDGSFVVSWAPTTTIAAPTFWPIPRSRTGRSDAMFTFTADEYLVRYQCRTDVTSWTACASPFTPVNVQPGIRTFSVRGIDGGGNKGAALATTWTVVPPPPNDDFAHRITLSGSTGSGNLDTTGATTQPREPQGIGGHTLWYEWVAPANGTTTFELDTSEGFGFAQWALFTNATDAAPQLARLTPYGYGLTFGRPSYHRFSVTAGTHYYLGIGNGPAGQVAPLTLRWYGGLPDAPGLSPQDEYTWESWAHGCCVPVTSLRNVAFRLFTPEGSGNTFECSLDGSAFTACPPLAHFAVGLGLHNVRGRAVDAAGGRGPAGAWDQFEVRNSARASVTITLAASPTPAVAGLPVTVTATVTPPEYHATGTVHFTEATHDFGTVALDANGRAAVTFTPTATTTVSAAYGGDLNFLPRTSQITLVPVATTTTLSATPNPAPAGSSITLDAAVTSIDASAPTGNVSFVVDGTAVGTEPVDVSGHATTSVSASALGGGQHTVVARYDGDAGHAPSSSVPSVLVTGPVPQSPTSTSITVTPNPVAADKPVTVGAFVISDDGSVPGSTATLLIDQVAVQTLPLDTSGHVIFVWSTATVPFGSHSLFVRYDGESTHLQSYSAAALLIVQ